MASSVEYLQYVLDLLCKVDHISYRKMMGEYILYYDGMIFGGIYDNRLLIKKTSSLDDYFFSEEVPYKGAKEMYLVDVEDPMLLKEIIDKLMCDLRKA